eukprot:11455308-Prorocentrum_lima.AAC.1
MAEQAQQRATSSKRAEACTEPRATTSSKEVEACAATSSKEVEALTETGWQSSHIFKRRGRS